MIIRERISANEKYEVLSTFSPNLILLIAGFLGGVVVALLLSPLLVPLVRRMDLGMGEGIVGFVMILGLLGAIAAKLLQWEYKVNREAYKRVAEFHILLVYPFFFLCLLVFTVALWFRIAPEVSGVSVWMGILIMALGSVILSPALGIIWRFWHVFWLSILSPVDWRTLIETRNFNRNLKMAFTEVKRYPSPLSLTIMDIDQSDRFKGRMMRKIQEELMNIVDKNVREADAIGEIESGKVAVIMAHTGSSGASIQTKRVKKVLKEHLKSLEVEGARVTLSIGIASSTPEMASYKDLIQKAQAALRRAKEEGGDQVSVG